MNHSTSKHGGLHLLAVALGEVDDEAARRRQRHQRPRAGMPQLRVDRRRLLLPCTHTANQTNAASVITEEKRRTFSPKRRRKHGDPDPSAFDPFHRRLASSMTPPTGNRHGCPLKDQRIKKKFEHSCSKKFEHSYSPDGSSEISETPRGLKCRITVHFWPSSLGWRWRLPLE